MLLRQMILGDTIGFDALKQLDGLKSHRPFHGTFAGVAVPATPFACAERPGPNPASNAGGGGQ